jgi:hypothetical protein
LLSIPLIPAVELDCIRKGYTSKVSEEFQGKGIVSLEKIKTIFSKDQLNNMDIFDQLTKTSLKTGFTNDDISTQSIVLLDIVIIVLFLLMVFL